MQLNRKLIACAAAAGAAVAANGAKSAQGGIVYQSNSGASFGSGGTVNIDFDHNGAEEFQLSNRSTPTRVVLLKGNGAQGGNSYATTGNGQPAALLFGTSIGSTSTFSNSFDAADLLNPTVDGNFAVDPSGNNPQYLGVKFQISDSSPTYYGWVGVDITNATDLSGVVTGYAYESNSGDSIMAGAVPEPASLALLAVGAGSLVRRRRA